MRRKKKKRGWPYNFQERKKTFVNRSRQRFPLCRGDQLQGKEKSTTTRTGGEGGGKERLKRRLMGKGFLVQFLPAIAPTGEKKEFEHD